MFRHKEAPLPSAEGVPMQGGGLVSAPLEHRKFLGKNSVVVRTIKEPLVQGLAVLTAVAATAVSVPIGEMLLDSNPPVLDISQAWSPDPSYPYYPEYAVDRTGEKPLPGTPCELTTSGDREYVCKTPGQEAAVLPDSNQAITGIDQIWGSYSGGVAINTGPTRNGMTIVFGLANGRQVEALVNPQAQLQEVILLNNPLPQTIFNG